MLLQCAVSPHPETQLCSWSVEALRDAAAEGLGVPGAGGVASAESGHASVTRANLPLGFLLHVADLSVRLKLS